MDLEGMTKEKKLRFVILLLVPLALSMASLIYLKAVWSFESPSGERFSPIENKPLFAGLLLFALGYLFFLGMLFSENILEMINKRRTLSRRE